MTDALLQEITTGSSLSVGLFKFIQQLFHPYLFCLIQIVLTLFNVNYG